LIWIQYCIYVGSPLPPDYAVVYTVKDNYHCISNKIIKT
jgi:hypothetical protein